MSIEQLVRECLTRGGLKATERGERRVTVDGISLPPIRWQAAVFTILYGGDQRGGLPPRAEDTAEKIVAEVERQRPRRADS